jgi:hypothetical protein
MASKKLNPATLAAGGARNLITVTAIGSENSAPSIETQHRRALWLARRFAISPDLAILLATLALGEVNA